MPDLAEREQRNERRGRRREDRGENPDFADRLVAINRVSKTVKGGKRFGFAALVVVGDQRGRVGFGNGKANDVPEAHRKAPQQARPPPHRLGQLSALFVADVAGRGADQPRDGVALHVLRHVEAQQLDAQVMRQLLGYLGLAHPGGAGEQEAAHRSFRLAQVGARDLDGGNQALDRLVLAEDHQAQVTLQGLEHVAVGGADRARRDARGVGHDLLDVGTADDAFAS